MAYPADLIAYEFVELGILYQKPITQMQLQKMLYFAQGYSLAKNDRVLIEDTFQAWKFGPVLPTIYKVYKSYGSKPITDISKIKNIPAALDRKLIYSEDIEAVVTTWQITKDVDTLALSAWTHKEGSPWKQVYKENESYTPIPNEEIKKYFIDFLTEPEIINKPNSA